MTHLFTPHAKKRGPAGFLFRNQGFQDAEGINDLNFCDPNHCTWMGPRLVSVFQGAIPMEDMSHVSGRAELTAAVDGLVDAVRHLTRGALRVKDATTVGHTTEVERALAGELAAAWDSERPEPQYKVQKLVERSPKDQTATTIAPAIGDVLAVTRNTGSGGKDAPVAPRTSIESIRFDRADAERKPALKENLIAAGIAELQDRLGGFIKS
jgi:hypothetical protein